MALDKMQSMFDEITKFSCRVNPDFASALLKEELRGKESLHDFEDLRVKLILQYMLALSQEKSELIDSLQWKWWSKKPVCDNGSRNDWSNAQVELVDMLFFFLSACVIAGLNADDLYTMFLKKLALNHKRQDNGYAEGTYNKVVDGVEDNKQIHLEQLELFAEDLCKL